MLIVAFRVPSPTQAVELPPSHQTGNHFTSHFSICIFRFGMKNSFFFVKTLSWIEYGFKRTTKSTHSRCPKATRSGADSLYHLLYFNQCRLSIYMGFEEFSNPIMPKLRVILLLHSWFRLKSFFQC